MVASRDQIFKDLKNKIYKPVYFLHGDEPYYIDEISSYIEKNVLDETEKQFNQLVVYGRDVNRQNIISQSKAFPMMGAHQVIIVKEAQDMRDFVGNDKSQEPDRLVEYLKKPQPSTILVFCYKYKKLDKRKALYKAFNKHAVIFESKKIYDNQLAPWISSWLNQKGFTITPRASAIIAEHLGNDLARIVNELSKLIINLPAGTRIIETHVEENIGISKEYNVFELQNAIGERSLYKVNRIAAFMASNSKEYPLQRVLPTLTRFFVNILIYHRLADKSKNNVASALSISPYFVRDYEKAARNFSPGRLFGMVSLLREFDLKSKGVGANPGNMKDGDLIRELMVKLMR